MEKNSFVRGALVLTVTTLLGKLLGAAYRIPLTALLGAEEMGIFAAAFHVFAFLGTLCASGVPPAAARICAGRLCGGDTEGAARIFCTARRLLLTAGFVFAVLMLLFAAPAARWMNCPDAAPALRMLAPGLFFTAWIAAGSAGCQGMQKMNGIAAVHLAEQVVRVAFGLGLARLLLPMGQGYGAAGALLGASLSSGVGALVAGRATRPLCGGGFDGGDAKTLLETALPITLGACAVPLASVLESRMLAERLALFGMGRQEAFAAYGVWTGMVMTLLTLPMMVTGALATALLPRIAAGDRRDRAITQGMTLTVLFSVFCCVGLYLFADAGIGLLYPSAAQEEHGLAVLLLRCGTALALAQSMNVCMHSVLHGMGESAFSAKIQGGSAALRPILSWLLLPKIGAAAFAAAAGISACVSGTAYLARIRRKTGSFPVSRTCLVCTGAGAVLMTITAFLLHPAADCATLGLCLEITICGGVYLLCSLPALKEEGLLWETSR